MKINLTRREPRASILYMRLSMSNHNYVKDLAKKNNISMADVIDQLVTGYKKGESNGKSKSKEKSR